MAYIFRTLSNISEKWQMYIFYYSPSSLTLVNFAEEVGVANILLGFLKITFELKNNNLEFIFVEIEWNLITKDRTCRVVNNLASCEKNLETNDAVEKIIKIEKTGNALSAFHKTDKTIPPYFSTAREDKIDKNITLKII